jgi:hypothetical protein
MEAAFERSAGGGDFRLGARFFGGDESEAGVTGSQVGGEVHNEMWLSVIG